MYVIIVLALAFVLAWLRSKGFFLELLGWSIRPGILVIGVSGVLVVQGWAVRENVVPGMVIAGTVVISMLTPDMRVELFWRSYSGLVLIVIAASAAIELRSIWLKGELLVVLAYIAAVHCLNAISPWSHMSFFGSGEVM